MAGAVGAHLTPVAVLAMGVSNVLADAMSMGVGEYLSSRSYNNYVLREKEREAWELEKWQNGKQQEMFQREAKFKHQKQNELVALQKRVQTGREEQKKQRQMDLERLLQRYQNVKSELEAQQNLERIRAERMASSGQWNWGSTTTKAGAQVA